MMVEWGSMLEEFPELCMKLVCAARVSPTSHFLTAVVLPVKFQDHLCSKDPWCDDCLEYSCVDDTGLLQVEGSKWSPDECHECVCSNGKVTCLTRPIICPNPPHKNCVKIAGPCCPTWNCTTGCVDENGEDHDLGTSWYSHPCIYHTCTVEGIMTRITDCFLGDPIHPTCVKFTPVGECCPEWNYS
ncbi:kielin/chordin-like protein [Homarus americanus]|uniref:kielin/chordin-like protein n=1 Tax=Homarus americanus TaxID=6706 RepID=UPI001C48470D|nr:kielin/chordin-like protein [Homarus americanus]